MDEKLFSLKNVDHKDTSLIFKPIFIYVIIFLAVILFVLALYDKYCLYRFSQNPKIYSSYYDFLLDRSSKIQVFIQWLWHPLMSEEYILFYANQIADSSEKKGLRVKDLINMTSAQKKNLIQTTFSKSSNVFHTLQNSYYDINL